MRRFLRNNSLGLVMFGLFLAFLLAQSVVGYQHYNEEQQTHGQSRLSYLTYVRSGDFIESVFENWESEFLQMGVYVIFTVFLYQKGSAESKKLQGSEPPDRTPQKSRSKRAPWPVRRGGATMRLYEHSLSLAFLFLFALSFWLHAYGGTRATCQEDLSHGESSCLSTFEYMQTSKFWYESFQNWQSEFLAVASIVVLSIYLRQKGSPESKPVNSPHDQTGTG